MFIPVTLVGRYHSEAHSKCPSKEHPAPSHCLSPSHIHLTRGRKCIPLLPGTFNICKSIAYLQQTHPCPLNSFPHNNISIIPVCHFQRFWKEEEKFQRTRESTAVCCKASRDIGGTRNQPRDLRMAFGVKN